MQTETEVDAQNDAQTRTGDAGDIYGLLVSAVDEYAIFAMDRDGYILTWNAGGMRLKGYSAEEAIGRHFSMFYTQPDLGRDHPANELLIAAQRGKYEEEGWRVRKDGTTFWANIVITALRDKNGVLRGFGKVTRDLTERRRADQLLRESEERFRLMVEGVQDYAIFMLDPSGKVATWNKGAQRAKGYEAVEIIGRHFSVFYPPEDLGSGKPEFELREATRRGKFEDESWRVRKDGTRFWANVVITAIRDPQGGLRGFAKVTRDLTERKQNEDRLREAYAGLEIKIAERTRDLQEAKDRAEAAVRVRDEFFSMASHELKTPIAALKLRAQIRKRNVLRGRVDDFAPEKLLLLCENDERQIERLGFLVENMLDISRITSGIFRLSVDMVDLRAVIADALERMAPLFKESENQITFECDTAIRGVWDRIRIEQVVINLLANARKYARGTPVEVRAWAEKDSVFVSVKDFGPGIATADQERIFERYERGLGAWELSGLGLGLYISDQIVRAHGGVLRVESEPGRGAEFTMELPLFAPEGSR